MKAVAERTRRRLIEQLRRRFARRGDAPRIMRAILGATGVAGFLSSVAMWRLLGVERMWVRYPLAVLLAWADRAEERALPWNPRSLDFIPVAPLPAFRSG
jgi:hypothetical protein